MIIQYYILLLWLFLSLVSLNHICKFGGIFVFPSFFIGIIGWITLSVTLFFLCRQFIKKSLIVFVVFFSLGFYMGPYLEPVADPIDHLHRTYALQNEKTSVIPNKNGGLLHYCMSSVFLSTANDFADPETILNRIDALHGVYWGFLMVGLYILSVSAGLPGRWALLSGLVAFLFFGTNRFSYFSYYSMAPSFTSMLIYWLWTAVFFFRRNVKDILTGLIMALVFLPILMANHLQEFVFLGFIVVIWMCCNVNDRLWLFVSGKRKNLIIANTDTERFSRIYSFRLTKNHMAVALYLFMLFALFFLLPQYEIIQKLISKLSGKNYWQKNQEMVLFWQGFHIMGKIWAYRVHDTLGIMSFLPLFLAPVIFWPKFIQIDSAQKIRIVVLSILPFIGYGVPLLHYAWVSNIMLTGWYYRLCYMSMFWLAIVFVLYGLERKCIILWHLAMLRDPGWFIDNLSIRSIKSIFFAGCLIALVGVSLIRQNPVYGKLDFIMLETKPWWKTWRPMLDDIIRGDRAPVFTDAMTSMVLKGVFNFPVTAPYRESFRKEIIDINSMAQACNEKSRRCVINLTGFTPSWVPHETGHWPVNRSITSEYYQYEGVTGGKLIDKLKNNPPYNCDIYF